MDRQALNDLLSDEQCNEFGKLLLPFNDMIRAIYKAGMDRVIKPQSSAKTIPYPLRLCVEIMNYCFISNDKTAEMKASEIKNKLQVFFTEEQIIEAKKLLTEESE